MPLLQQQAVERTGGRREQQRRRRNRHHPAVQLGASVMLGIETIAMAWRRGWRDGSVMAQMLVQSSLISQGIHLPLLRWVQSQPKNVALCSACCWLSYRPRG